MGCLSSCFAEACERGQSSVPTENVARLKDATLGKMERPPSCCSLPIPEKGRLPLLVKGGVYVAEMEKGEGEGGRGVSPRAAFKDVRGHILDPISDSSLQACLHNEHLVSATG